MRILLATDHADLGQALTLFLSERRHEVVDIAGDVDELVTRATDEHPDVVLVDWRLGERESTRAVADLMDSDDPTPVIVLSTSQQRRRAGASGAAAFATLGDHPESLLEALDQVDGRRADPSVG